MIVESAQQDRTFRGGLAFVAGGTSEGYGSGSDLGTAFNVEQSIFGSSVAGFQWQPGLRNRHSRWRFAAFLQAR